MFTFLPTVEGLSDYGTDVVRCLECGFVFSDFVTPAVVQENMQRMFAVGITTIARSLSQMSRNL